MFRRNFALANRKRGAFSGTPAGTLWLSYNHFCLAHAALQPLSSRPPAQRKDQGHELSMGRDRETPKRCIMFNPLIF